MAQYYPTNAVPKPAPSIPIPFAANDNYPLPMRRPPMEPPANDNLPYQPPPEPPDHGKRLRARLAGIAFKLGNPASLLGAFIWGEFQGLPEYVFNGEPVSLGWPAADGVCRSWTNHTHQVGNYSTYCGPQAEPALDPGVKYTITTTSNAYVHKWEFGLYRNPVAFEPNTGNPDLVWRYYRRHVRQVFYSKTNPANALPKPQPHPSPYEWVTPTVTQPFPAVRFRPDPGILPADLPIPYTAVPKLRPHVHGDAGPVAKPRPHPMPTVTIRPDNSVSVDVRPPRPPSRPPKGTKEKKAALTIGGTPVGMAFNLVTESLDVLNCLNKSIPGKYRAKGRWDATRPGPGRMVGNAKQPGRWRRPPPQEIAAAVWANVDKIDVAKLIQCLAENQVEDFLIGQIGQLTKKANKRRPFYAGVAFGPAL